MVAQLTFPNDTNRHVIIGQTGSGKTYFGLWCLSQRSYDRMPWVIIDSKRDDLIEDIPRLEEISIARKPPTARGLYVARPSVADFENGTVTGFLYDMWRQENIGLFIDEGYSFDRHDPALKTVLTQGRSKHVPMIALSQKPSWTSPFLFSESEFKSIFYLDMPNDLDRVKEWMPARTPDPLTGGPIDPYALPDHHQYWRHKRLVARLGPCEPMDLILERFERRRPRRKWL